MNLIINGFIAMSIPLLLTIIIECLLAFLLKIKRKNDIINIIYVNCITNPILNYLMIVIDYFFSKRIFNIILIFLELMVICFEYNFYKKNSSYKKVNPLLLSWILNLSSFTLGLIITNFF